MGIFSSIKENRNMQNVKKPIQLGRNSLFDFFLQ